MSGELSAELAGRTAFHGERSKGTPRHEPWPTGVPRGTPLPALVGPKARSVGSPSGDRPSRRSDPACPPTRLRSTAPRARTGGVTRGMPATTDLPAPATSPRRAQRTTPGVSDDSPRPGAGAHGISDGQAASQARPGHRSRRPGGVGGPRTAARDRHEPNRFGSSGSIDGRRAAGRSTWNIGDAGQRQASTPGVRWVPAASDDRSGNVRRGANSRRRDGPFNGSATASPTAPSTAWAAGEPTAAGFPVRPVLGHRPRRP